MLLLLLLLLVVVEHACAWSAARSSRLFFTPVAKDASSPLCIRLRPRRREDRPDLDEGGLRSAPSVEECDCHCIAATARPSECSDCALLEQLTFVLLTLLLKQMSVTSTVLPSALAGRDACLLITSGL